MIDTQFQCKIKCFRSDNAKELAFSDFFHQRGVLHQYSCVERPQQNSVVERKHQHLLNVARALYFQSRIPISFWNDCVLTACYLINRTPSPLLHGKTPFELLHHVVVDYSSLKVFGCLAFASTLPAARSKFHPRARMCVFIGYPPGVKGYKLYDLDSKQVFFSRDVIFHEKIFPFHNQSPLSNLVDPFPDLVIPIALPGSYPDILIPDPTPESSSPLHQPRRSNRTTKQPSYLRDFHCNLLQSSPTMPYLTPTTQYPLSKYLSYNQLTPIYKSFVLNVSSSFEPKFYHQAIQYPEWQLAMDDELAALERNNTWSIIPLPFDKHSIGCKWVYKLKLYADGSVERHKARLVAKGFNQQEGIDFLDTFSPVAKLVTVKVLLALAACKNRHLTQLDITNAFLNGDLLEEVYMDLPPGYKLQGEQAC